MSDSGAGLVNGGVSFWWAQAGRPQPRPPLEGDLACDVCILGGGLTGLWTAYRLLEANPNLDVVILEAEFAGYGASGRNGGWLSAEVAGPLARYAAGVGGGAAGRAAAIDLAHAMVETVDEVIAVCAAEGIDAEIAKDGVLYVARNAAQAHRLSEQLADVRAWGLGEDHLRHLTAAETDERVRVAGALGALYSPHCARVQPAKLTAGVAGAAERRGARIFERTRAIAVEPGVVRTDRGDVRARYVLRALEGYTASLPGYRRRLLPMNSAMVVTQPLAPSVWTQIGWRGAELLGDEANAYCYAQRTADGRIALGGRGVPYRFGSRTDVDGVTQPATIDSLVTTLHELFPATRGCAIEHAWCGVLGVPRDWTASVGLGADGVGWAGGYVGSGLTTTALAARTLADLVLGRESRYTRLPWVNRKVRGWEPEPLRWLGVHAMYALFREADRREAAGAPGPSTLSRIGNALTGR